MPDHATLALAAFKPPFHIAAGCALGAMGGAALAVAPRLSSLLSRPRARASPPATAAFYPARTVVGPRTASRPAGASTPAEDPIPYWAMMTAGGSLGLLVGGQLGSRSGHRAARDVVVSSGREDKIIRRFQRGQSNAALQLRAMSAGQGAVFFGTIELPGLTIPAPEDHSYQAQEDIFDHLEAAREEALRRSPQMPPLALPGGAPYARLFYDEPPLPVAEMAEEGVGAGEMWRETEQATSSESAE